MNIKKSKLLVAVATIALASITACKKGGGAAESSPSREKNKQEKAFEEDINKRISTYRYWKPTAITADSPVDIYKKGATTDIFSQRPEHQADYHIEVEYITKELPHYVNGKKYVEDYYSIVNSLLHFGPKTIQMKRDEIANDGYVYTPEKIEAKIRKWSEVTFSLSKDSKGERQLEWIKPFHDQKHTHSMTYYKIASLQNNEFKLYYFDKELNTTIRVTFTGSKTIPQ